MTKFLYVPSTRDTRVTRRVDLANIGALFAEGEDSSAPDDAPAFRRFATLLLLLIFVFGNMMLIARPQALAASIFKATSTVSVPA